MVNAALASGLETIMVAADCSFPRKSRPRSLPPPKPPRSGPLGRRRHEIMEQELKALRAETIAIQAVLTNVLFELKLLDPVLADMVSRSFDQAATQIENSALQLAEDAAASEPLVKALSIIEDLRTASLNRQGGLPRT